MKTSTLTSRFAGVATLALAVLPIAALTTAAHAAERVHVADLNLAAPTGHAVFEKRVDGAAHRFCRLERNLTAKGACEAGVRTEANEKASSAVVLASRI